MKPGGIAAIVCLLGGCATPKVLLLPGEAGHPTGALAVLAEDGREQVLDQPLDSARLSRNGATVRKLAGMSPAYRTLIADLPPPPTSYTLYFVEGTTALVPSSRPVLERILQDIAARAGAEVQVTGHTDTLGAEEDNDRLSDARATEIMGALIAEGFPRDATSAVGRGERELAVETADNVANEQNRRVEVIVR